MQDIVFRKGLIAPARLKALSRTSDRRGLVQLATHAGAIGATGALLAWSWGSLWAVPVFMAHGLLLNFLYAAQHECSHWTAFRTRRLNDLVGRICGFLLLYPRDYDRWFHFTHHRHTQDPERDPEIMGSSGFTTWSFLADLTGLLYWGRRVAVLLRLAIGNTAQEPYLTASQRPAVILEARMHLAAYAAIAVASLMFQSWAAMLFWIAPLVAMKWTHQVQNLIEHTGLSHAANTLANTRTIAANPVLRWLLWNMSYHTVHHSFPGVPFHRLPALHAAVVAAWDRPLPRASYGQFIREMLRTMRQTETAQPAE